MPRKRTAKKKHWSYNAGERGRNWVRAFQHARDGKFYLEWREPGPDGRMRRRAVLLRGVTDCRTAKVKADELAFEFAELSPANEPVTVKTLLACYRKEVTPTKGKQTQGHDRGASRLWLAFFDAQAEIGRRSMRRPESLDRIDWDRFIEWRRVGRIPGWPRPVRDRSVQYDLKFLVAVLNWAAGTPLLTRNPWSSDVRRSQRWEMPKEKNPRRPAMTPELRKALVEHAPGWQFGLALVLERETLRRNSAIRRLLWSDIDQERWEVTWRGETDKTGRGSRTPLTPGAIEALRSAPSRGLGPVPVFPAWQDPSVSTSRYTFQVWLRRAKASLLKATPEEKRDAMRRALDRVGFHAEKRAGVRDPRFRRLPPKVQEEFAGTSWDMLRETYDHVSVSDMRDALGIPEADAEVTTRDPITTTIESGGANS
jgi:integrase